jgi:Leucine-rich repeat (LRR) protein
LPPELCLATILAALAVDGNPLRSPPPEVVREGRGQILEYLRRLHASATSDALLLAGMSLVAFPVEAQLYSRLTRIDLADNLLEELPRAVGSQPALTDLSAAHNRLQSVDARLGCLAGLTRLHLPFNRLSALPDTVEDLRALTVLNLVENEFTTLDTPICLITALTDLRMSHNRLEAVLPVVGRLGALRRLHLENNMLRGLPEELGQLTGLAYLSLSQVHFPVN